MRRVFLFALLVWPSVAISQSAIPVFLGQNQTMLPPTMDGSGRTLVFGSAISSDGTNLGKTDLYTIASDGSGLRRLTNLPGSNTPFPAQGTNAVSFSSNAARAAFIFAGSTATPPPSPPPTGPVEEVHVVDVATGTDRVVAMDTQACVQPLEAPICVGCFFSCINTPHISSDGSKVLYSSSRNQPFYVANADGSSVTRLPVYSGALAPSPQRVISRNGLVAFTSSAPSAPPPVVPGVVIAPYIQDIYVMNLDGTNIQNVTKFGNNTPLPAPFLTLSLLSPSNATISADGGTIAFEGTPQTTTGTGGTVNSTEIPVLGIPVAQIWLVRSDGSALRALTTGSDSSTQPSISGDGSLVAFVQNGQICTVHSDGSNFKVLTKFQMSAAHDPVLSDDGSVIVFDIGPSNGGIGALYAINSDGTNLHAVFAPRTLNQNGVTGTGGGTAPSPGSLFSAYGLNFSTDSVTAATNFPLPTVLGGVSLLVNGRPAPLLAVSPWQVNAQLASDIVPGPAAFQLKFADGATPSPAAANVNNVSPAIFILPPAPCPPAPPQTGPIQPGPFVVCTIWQQAAAFHANSAVPADQAHPAAVGEVLEIYGTGLGLTDPIVPAGMPAPASPPAKTLTIPQVLIGTIPAQVTFAGLTPGFAGVYQVNVVVPPGVKSNSQSVVWRVGTTESGGTIFIQ